jgi:hypothetical protein
MSTIKTQLVSGQRRIITKVVNGQRRVSCECCEEEDECCMYPAVFFGNTYGADDLPDAVTVNWADRFTGSMGKSGSGYAGGGATLQIVNGIWQLSDSDGTRNVGPCLIRGDGNLTQGNDLVEDQFADEYNVQITAVQLNGSPLLFEDTVARISKCEWRSATENAGMFFAEELQKWRMGGQSDPDVLDWQAIGTKENNQNTPTGTYEATSTFGLNNSENITMTVSEA